MCAKLHRLEFNMNRNHELEELKKVYQAVEIPKEGVSMMKKSIEKAKAEKNHKIYYRTFKNIAMTAAAILLAIIILPNTNSTVAMAMEKIPLIGSIVKVVTFRNYEYQDGHNEANVSIPQIQVEGDSQAADKINTDITDYTAAAVKQFETDMESTGEGYQGLDVSYEVITDTDEWFTLKLSILETKASGYQRYQYYHINKQTGHIVTLKDLFQDNSDYIKIISENIIEQMRTQMSEDENLIYFLDNPDFPEDNFKSIGENQSYYFNIEGNLVIVFDEYAAAPGYMGTPEFVIPKELLEPIYK